MLNTGKISVADRKDEDKDEDEDENDDEDES